jgi:hypothetical protein
MGITAPGTEFFRPETKPKFRVVSPARDQISKIVRRTGRVNAACSHKVSVIRDSEDCVVGPGGVLRTNVFNELEWQTYLHGSFDPQRFSGALANHGAEEADRAATAF